MTWDQVAALIRQIIPFLGGFIVAKGWISSEQLIGITGAIISVGGVVWSFFANSKSSIIQSAAAMSETRVSTDGTGSATITVKDPTLSAAAVKASA